MPSHPWIDERTGLLDDAAVVRPDGATRSLVLTMDVITPIVDDPRTFGAIAACNALSDVYAMGGRPELALSFLGHDVCARARCPIVGGHTMKDSEPKCGLSVVGSIEPDRVWSQRFARAGDALVLTKAVGTGLIGQAVRNGVVDEAALAAAIHVMTQLNDVACEVGRTFGVHACTDVTGFGLLGHLRNLVEASNVTVSLRASAVPFLPTAHALAVSGCIPGGSRRNLDYALAVTTFDDAVDEPTRLILADAQTSGGLLLVLRAERADGLVRRLREAGIDDAAEIGVVTGAERGAIDVVAR